MFQDAYRGEWDSEEAFAENFADECGYLADQDSNPLLWHVDFESYARDLFCGGLYSIDSASGVHVFESL